jgi:LPXTG-motif cell wall-anchored protein
MGINVMRIRLINLVRRLVGPLGLLGLVVTPVQALASTYGSAGYGTNTYDGTLHIGPVTLPDTGSAILVGLAATALVTAIGLAAWARMRRRKVT